jgi:hypothetical protein
MFLRTRTRGWSSITATWVDSVSDARVYGRKCDASNSIIGIFGSYYFKRNNPQFDKSNLEVVPVTLSISTSCPSIKISPEVLDRATRFMMTDEAKKNGAPASLVASFDDLSTDEVVLLVTVLYGAK